MLRAFFYQKYENNSQKPKIFSFPKFYRELYPVYQTVKITNMDFYALKECLTLKLKTILDKLYGISYLLFK